jgi:hypothetical protein
MMLSSRCLDNTSIDGSFLGMAEPVAGWPVVLALLAGGWVRDVKARRVKLGVMV